MRILSTLVATLLLSSLSSCGDPNAARAKALQNEVDQLQRNIDEAQQTARRLEIQVQAARDERKKLEEDKTKANEQKTQAEEELNRLKSEFETYKSKYKVSLQMKIPGLLLGQLAVHGVLYSNVKVTELGTASVKFSHGAGTAIVGLEELPAATKDLLALSQEHDPLPSGTARTAATRRGLDTDHRRQQLEYNLEIKEMHKITTEAQITAHKVDAEIAGLISRGTKPSSKLLEYAEETRLRANQLRAQTALMEAKQTEVEALYSAQRRKLAR
jgi:hypothetical protein